MVIVSCGKEKTQFYIEDYSVGKVIWEISYTIMKMLKLRFNWTFGINN